MSDRTQIGPAVDADLWRRFREDVKARKGQVRGVLGDELETAIRQYLRDEPSPTEQRIDARLARLEDAIGVTSADGGTDTRDAAGHTHAPSRIDDAREEKPGANAATEKKVVYLAERVLEQEVPQSREIQQVARDRLREVVKDEYGFRRDTAKRYVAELVDHFDLHEHPYADGILVSESEYQEIVEQRREDIEAEVTDQ